MLGAPGKVRAVSILEPREIFARGVRNTTTTRIGPPGNLRVEDPSQQTTPGMAQVGFPPGPRSQDRARKHLHHYFRR